jgi:hypothetical protein
MQAHLPDHADKVYKKNQPIKPVLLFLPKISGKPTLAMPHHQRNVNPVEMLSISPYTLHQVIINKPQKHVTN